MLSASYSGCDRCCRKSPKLLCGKFPAERRNTRRLLVDMPTGQLPKSLVSSSHYDASPHTIVGSPHLRLGKFVFSNAKRLFRQHRPKADISCASSSFEPLPCEQEVVERLSSCCHTLILRAKNIGVGNQYFDINSFVDALYDPRGHH